MERRADAEPAVAAVTQIEVAPELRSRRASQLRIIARRFIRNRVALTGLVFLLVISLAAIFAPLLDGQTAHYDPNIDPNIFLILRGPMPGHPLGTDDVGRDELARMLFGGRVSLTVGVSVAFLSTAFGVLFGAIAGFYGGWLDNVMMRLTDALLSVPFLVVLFVLSVTFADGSVLSIVLLISAFAWPGLARIVRGEFLALKEREFLLAARTLGASNLRLMFRHMLPNAVGPILVSATLTVGDAIITESALSFFGFGIQPPTASWGSMLETSRSYITSDPLLLYAPGFAILMTVLAFNLMGDGLRDALDPYMTER